MATTEKIEVICLIDTGETVITELRTFLGPVVDINQEKARISKYLKRDKSILDFHFVGDKR